MKLELKEIIWEITAKCNNKCSYCGSKERLNKEIDKKTIMDVAKKIAEYPPESINISGGDPMLVSYDMHKTIISLFKKSNISCKLIVNPKSIKDFKILSLYDWIGVSINNKEELELLGKNCSQSIKDKTTVITNFNTNNIFLFDKIAEGLKENGIKTWQIQFTMDKEDGDSLLYKNPDALDYLQKKVNSIEGIDVVPADNMNDGDCSAGINSCGIDCDGNVMPCLSMFSWCTDKKKLFAGNLLKDSLKEVWENEFKECRFKKFKCCKDVCNRKTINIKDKKEPLKIKDKKPYEPNIVALYGVSPRKNRFMMYGVSPKKDNIVILYGVFTR